MTAGAVAFGAIAPPERCPPVTSAVLRSSASLAVGWFVANQAADGSWLYSYDATTDEAGSGYNVVRHAGAVEGLYQAAAYGVPGALDAADRGLRWALDRVVVRGGWTAVGGESPLSTGATALLTAGLVERRDVTGDPAYDAVLERMGRFVAGQVRADGAVLAEADPDTGRPVPGATSKYFTGEAYWALARLHVAFPRGGWGALADRVGAYLATRRDRAEHRWPPIPDHWAGYGLAVTATFPERSDPSPLTASEVAYARRQAALFGSQVRWVSQRFGPWGVLVRGPHRPRGGGYGVIEEGLTGLWRAAGADARLADLRRPIAARAECAAGLAIRAQTGERESKRYATPARVAGAWLRDGRTRMDDQQHALDGLLRAIAIVDAAPDDSVPPRPAASAWLWLAGLVLAANPVVAARAASTAPGRRRARGGPDGGAARRQVATGALLGVVVSGGLALVSGPLLDAIDVSAPSLRIAAGAVVGLAAVSDLLWPEGAADLPPALAALRPGVLLSALAAGAERGVGLVAVSLGLAGAAAVALASTVSRGEVDELAAVAAVGSEGSPTEPAAGRRDATLTWVLRALSAAAIAAGVALVVSGVLDV